MSPEFILLIISLIGNFIVILKRINLIYTPCISIDCRNNVDVNEDEVDINDNPNQQTMMKRFIQKITPRKDAKHKKEVITPLPV